jgi:hypothetical protein
MTRTPWRFERLVRDLKAGPGDKAEAQAAP